MRKSVDFYFDFISPASYIAYKRLHVICERTGASINFKPMLLGGIFKAVGNTSPITVQAKWKWIQKDFARHAEYYDIPYQMNPHFIFSTVNAMRGAMWALEEGCIEAYSGAVYKAAWVDGKDLSSAEVMRDVLKDAGLEAEVVLGAMTQPEIKKALITATEDAAERGVFGAPTMFVDDEIYFGQDRLDWVERALES